MAFVAMGDTRETPDPEGPGKTALHASMLSERMRARQEETGGRLPATELPADGHG